MYHRVLPEADEVSPDITAAVFDAQMRGLREHFTPLPLGEAIEGLQRESLPSRAVCVTFDDGYRNNAEAALPILVRHGIPAAFFVTSGFLDGGIMWNDVVIESIRRTSLRTLAPGPWAAEALPLDSAEARRSCVRTLLANLKHAPPDVRKSNVHRLAEVAKVALPGDLMMRPEHVRALRAAGMEIGAHSVTHPILAKLAPDDAEREIVESGRQLAGILDEPVRLFAYPNGKPGVDYDARHVDMVRRAGYRCAVSTSAGIASGSCDPLQIPRVAPWGGTARGFSLRLLRTFVEGRRGLGAGVVRPA
jgi:peptidoglycan/xylan/chitin deacetylase (PgdA/CDA1 family)